MAKRVFVLLAVAAAVGLMSTGLASAGPVTLHDDAKVLDAARVSTAANALPDPVQVFTTEKFSDNNAAFDQEAQQHVTGPADVVIAINTKSKHLAIRTGANSHIRDTAPAIAAFKSAFGSGDYTAATVASLNSLASTTNQPGPATNRQPAPAPQAKSDQHSGFSWVGLLCPILVVGVIVAAVVVVLRRRGGGGGGMFNRGGPPAGYSPGYNEGGAPAGYGPGYNQGSGMSRGMAGGLGAAAGAVGGGLLGYELGRMGDRDEEDRDRGEDQSDRGYDQSPQEWGGGGGDADFGGGDSGGSSGDF
jgi:hypothetical protein